MRTLALLLMLGSDAGLYVTTTNARFIEWPPRYVEIPLREIVIGCGFGDVSLDDAGALTCSEHVVCVHGLPRLEHRDGGYFDDVWIVCGHKDAGR